MDDGLTASAEAVERLRRALISGGDISGASRNLRTHNFLFLTALASAVFKVRYGPGSGRDLSAFIGRVADACDGSGAVPAGQGEAYVQAVMDPVAADLSRLDPVAVLETQLAFYVALFREWQPTGDEVAALFAEAAEGEASLASMFQSSPQLEPVGEQMGEFLAEMEANLGGPTPEMLARGGVPGDLLAESGLFGEGGLLADVSGDFSSEDLGKVMEVLMPDLQRLDASSVVQMARLLDSQGRSAEAIAAYQQVIASGEGEPVALAARNLGILHAKMGDTAAALAAYEVAIEQRHPVYSVEAMAQMAMLLDSLGRSAEAIAAYQQVIASSRSELVAWAAIRLGNLHAKLGDTAASRDAFQAAIDHPHPDYTPHAACALGEQLSQLEDISGAQQAWQLAEDSEHPQWSAVAAFELGLLLAGQGELDAARAHFQRAIESGHRDAAPRAALSLGHYLAEAGDTAGALAALRIAARSGNPQYRREARQRLRSLPKSRLSGIAYNS